MLQAIILGAFAQSSLLFSGLAVYWIQVSQRTIGWLAGFGSGALISAIAFDLIAQDSADGLTDAETMIWLLIGAFIFTGGERMIERRFATEGTGGALGIVLGAIVDGIPESIIFGIQIASGLSISMSFLFAVFMSNIPQSLAPSADLAQVGWSRSKMALVWGSVVVCSGLAAGLGFLLASNFNDVNGARMAALAAGGLLAMITISLIPFAYERGGPLTGIGTVVGFAVAFML